MPRRCETSSVESETREGAPPPPLPSSDLSLWCRLQRAALVLVELTKARLVSLVTVTAAVGFVMAGGSPGPGLWWLVLGTALSAAGSMALNEWAEAGQDARMERTRHRPLPAGEIAPRAALAIGLLLVTAGVSLLAWHANALTAALGLTVVVTYVLVYTPLKTRTPACTLAGAVCGALPPTMGWAAVEGRLPLGAFVLAAVLFLWQIPHFLALAWLYRDDYERAGFRMLPVVDPSGNATTAMAVVYSLALVPVTEAAAWLGMAGSTYAVGAAALGSGLLLSALALERSRAARDARRLFVATLLYLPLVLGLMAVDRRTPWLQADRLGTAAPPAAVREPARPPR